MSMACLLERISSYSSGFALTVMAACLALCLAAPGAWAQEEEPGWQVTRSVNKTVIPADDNLIYEDQASGAGQPETPASPPLVGRIGPLRTEVQADALVIAVPCGHAPGEVSFANLFGPKRLALDIQGAWILTGENMLRPDDPRVKYVAVKRDQHKLRLMVHYADENAMDVMEPIIKVRPELVILYVPLP